MGCIKNDDPVQRPGPPPSSPKVITGPVTNITATTATVGGTISDGGDPVIVSGICWSKTDPNPSISNDTINTNVTNGAFTVLMKNLSPGTTYYVRAYAKNGWGMGLGNVISFNSQNKAPEVKNITILGSLNVSQKITARYSYVDTENDTEGATSFQWYYASDTTGSPVTTMNVTDSQYTIPRDLENKFLRVGIIPKAKTGSSPGAEVRSFWVGPVKGFLSETFLYSGRIVTYGVITSSVTQRQWLDRNLGAPNAPTAYNDWANEGDLFQWGRPDDGHQLISRAATTSGTTAFNGVTNTLSTIDVPGHSLFVLTSTAPLDWHVPQNDKLWQVTGGANNVCPAGWHVPTTAEWEAENLGNLQDAYTKLKITAGGQRVAVDGKFSLTIENGAYWTSSVFTSTSQQAFSFQFVTGAAAIKSTASPNANGLSVRCIKNQ